ncbi:MAG: DUF4115 domain-containing protein [Candidatus Thiodiazotropha sp.]|jgi:cytoskeleton protein RodZ
MNAAKNSEQDTAPASYQGPGSQLRKLRQSQRIEIAGVAAQLHLPVPTVNALELDDYERLPGPVFIKGYLRNYARLLGVNEDAVIASYQRLQPPVEESVAVPSQQKNTQVTSLHSSHGIIRLITWGILFTLVVMLIFWWLNRAELIEPLPIPAKEQTLETPQENLVPQIETAPPQEVTAQPTSEAEIVSEKLKQAPELDISLTTKPFAPVQESFDAKPLQVETSLESSMVSELPDMGLTPSDEQQPETATNTPGVSKFLIFEFSGACWVEVRDQAGDARIIGEMRSGTVRRLNSQYGPFSIVFGDASVVKLSVDGQPIDLKSFTKGKVARFTLDPAQM